MKTTFELPDDLLRKVKLHAVNRGQKLKDTVAELLRRGLAAPPADAAASKRPRLTKDKSGLPLVVCRHAASQAQEMTPDRVADVLLDQGTNWAP